MTSSSCRPRPSPQALKGQLTCAAIQRSLKRLGLFDGSEDGQFGPELRAAIRDFQARRGTLVTGHLTLEQVVDLHERARISGPPLPLPPFQIIDVLRRSETGDRDAARLRGMLHDRVYDKGPLPKDMTEAVRWYRQAAVAGDADAAAQLGSILTGGQGVNSDLAEAVRWLTFGAAAGRPDAAYELAELYRDGSGVRRDEDEAVRLFRRAAAGDRGEAVAQLRLMGAK